MDRIEIKLAFTTGFITRNEVRAWMKQRDEYMKEFPPLSGGDPLFPNGLPRKRKQTNRAP